LNIRLGATSLTSELKPRPAGILPWQWRFEYFAQAVGIVMNIATWLLVRFNGRQVGTDNVGNRYFIEREARPGGGKPRRWVLYGGSAQASSVPAGWNAWLEHGREPLAAVAPDRSA
jgi:hypothetical protein